MSRVLKARPEDFERVYPLLAQFNNPYVDKETRRRLFAGHWDSDEGYCGTMLIEADRVVGFLGLVFSRRHIGDKEERFCNLTSWIVEPAHRKKSIFLLIPVLKLRGLTLTDFTPSKEVYALLKKAGFRDLETHCRYILPFPRTSRGGRLSQLSVGPGSSLDDSVSGLNPILKDHIPLDCHALHIQMEFGECVIVLTRLVRRKPPFRLGVIHHISDVASFRRSIGSMAGRICRRFGVNALYVDERFLGGWRIPFSIKKKLDWPQVYRSEDLEPETIDSLYSERILLKI